MQNEGAELSKASGSPSQTTAPYLLGFFNPRRASAAKPFANSGFRPTVTKFLDLDMSASHIIFGNTPIREWIDRYEESHKHPINRTFHTLGIPMIAISLPLFLVAPLFRGFWKIPLSLFTVGWIFQFAGHVVEGKPPEFFKDWRFLFVGVRWCWSKIQGRE